MTRAILTLNAGSSSIKFALYAQEGTRLSARAVGGIDGIGTAPHLVVRDGAGTVVRERRWDDAARDPDALLDELLDWVDGHLGGDSLVAVGHRVVHGGSDFVAPVRLTDATLAAIEALSPLAPLHQSHNVAAIRAVGRLRPELAQVACFDTAFHHDQPELATRIALPHAFVAQGIRRYGFHGLSYEYVADRLAECDPALATGRVIVAHLGNGASLCALHGGRSIDTTMGFSTLDGLVMGTRAGTIDPGVLLYLLQQRAMPIEALSDLLYHRSGLLGVSGLSSDMRVLLDSDAPAARAAVELFVYRFAREAGALVAALGGLDGLVFTAGIGENAPEIRARACRRIAWLGLELDDAANARGDPVISTADSRIQVRVIPTDEEVMIARHTRDLLARPDDPTQELP